MRALPLLALALPLFLLSPGEAAAQVKVRVRVPTIEFEVKPPEEVVAPGIRVVPDLETEVFVVGGWYWTRASGVWFKSSSWEGGWQRVGPKAVPPGLARIPPGKYRLFRGKRGTPKARVRVRERRKDEPTSASKRGKKRKKRKSRGRGR